MALSPELEINLIEENQEIAPLATYRIDWEKNEITNEIIEGLEAIEQFVHMALGTARYAHAIFSDNYAGEIEELLADAEVTAEFKMMELPRLIREALIYDEQIEDITDIEIEHVDDAFHVKFIVVSNAGILKVEEVFE